jgi:hypothetical protein
MSLKPSNYDLLRQLDKVSQDLGMDKIEPLDPGGAGDISFVADLLPASTGSGPPAAGPTRKVSSSI